MSFLKNNAYWIVAVVIGLGISVVMLSQRGDRESVSPPSKAIETHKQPEAISHPTRQTGEAYTYPAARPLQRPDSITDPEVKAAWDLVESLKTNIWDYGGQPTPRATELIDTLMPPPDRFRGETAHDDVEVTLELLSELSGFRDPRAAVVFATYAGEGIVSGHSLKQALVEIGPPAIPYMLPYIEPPYNRFEKNPLEIIHALGPIGVQHREELEGVIKHIIIPKLEAFIEAEHTMLMFLPLKYACESLSMLEKEESK